MASPILPECASHEEDAARSPPGTFSRFSRFARDSALMPASWLLSQLWSSAAPQEPDSGQKRVIEASRSLDELSDISSTVEGSLDELSDVSSTVEDWDVASVASSTLRQGGDDVAVQEAEVAGDCEQGDDIKDTQKTEDDDYSAAQLHEIQQTGDGAGFMRSDIIIAVMGVTGAGKSTFISLLCEQDIEIGHGQKSCTTNVGVYHFKLRGVRIWLIDTPGFDDTNRSDTEVLGDIAYWLARAYTRDMQLAGIIYLHRITDVRMQGSALRNLRLFKELCGRDELRSVILATTHWTHGEGNSVPEEVGRARVKELETTKEFWGGMIERGSRVEKHDGSEASALRIVSNLVSRHDSVTLKIQRQMVDEERSLFETAAGQELQREMIEERRRAEETLKKLKLDMEFALNEKDKEWQETIKQDRADLEARIDQRTREMEALKINLTKLAAEKDEQFRKMERKWNREKAALEARLHDAIVRNRNPGDTHTESATALVSDRSNRDISSRRGREIDNGHTNEVPGRTERTTLTRRETPSKNQTPSRVEPEVQTRHEASPRHGAPTIHDREILVVSHKAPPRHETRPRSERESQGRLEREILAPYEAEMSARLDLDILEREIAAKNVVAQARRAFNQLREERENPVPRLETRTRQEHKTKGKELREVLAGFETRTRQEHERKEKEQREILARLEAEAERDRELLARYQLHERPNREDVAGERRELVRLGQKREQELEMEERRLRRRKGEDRRDVRPEITITVPASRHQQNNGSSSSVDIDSLSPFRRHRE